MFFYWLGASQNEEFVDENQARFFSKIEKFFEEVKQKTNQPRRFFRSLKFKTINTLVV